MQRLACLVVYFSISYATLAISSENFVAFDGASASSSYSQEAFAARQALNAGSGYWCRCVRSNGFGSSRAVGFRSDFLHTLRIA